MRGLGRWVAVCTVALAAGAGCGEKKGGNAGTSATAATSATAKHPYSDEGKAFMLGRQWGLACVYSRMNKTSEASDAIEEARSIASELGVPVPALPTHDDALTAMRSPMIPDAITAKKGERTRDVYRLAVALSDLLYGAYLQGELTSSIAEVEHFAKAAGAPESIWKTQLDAAKPKPTDGQLRKLTDDLEAHYTQ